MWYPYVPALAGEFRVVRTDLRGLGLSKVPVETFRNSIQSLALDAISLLDYLCLERAIWIGEATGALVGLYLAATVPERLHCLISMSMALRIPDAPVPAHLTGDSSMDLMLSKGMRSWAEASVKARPWMREAPPGYVQWYVDQIARNDPRLAAEFYRPLSEADMLPLLEDIGVPMMYINGDRDFMIRADHLALLLANSNAQVVTVEGPGYDIGYARPKACLAEVRRFLQELGLLDG
jgi:pimeloyl-ACP methyl ester carboxylesterase